MAEPIRCVTCSDTATAARVVALGNAGLACVVDGEGESEISLELVDARVGDVVLVHAGVAIGLVS